MPTPLRKTVERGYGPNHRRERERWAAVIARRDVDCQQPHCLKPTRTIPAGSPSDAWDLGHNDDRTDWIGPTHRRCNRWAATHPDAEPNQTTEPTGRWEL